MDGMNSNWIRVPLSVQTEKVVPIITLIIVNEWVYCASKPNFAVVSLFLSFKKSPIVYVDYNFMEFEKGYTKFD